MILRAATRWGRLTIHLLHLLFYLPSKHSNHTVQWKDGFWFLGLRFRVVDAGQGIRFDIARPR